MDWRTRLGILGGHLVGPRAGRLTRLGVLITTTSALLLVFYWLMESLRGGTSNPYLGILFLLVLPGGFVLGLLLIPLGIWIRRRSEPAQAPAPLDLKDPGFKRSLMVLAVLTLVNLVVVGTATAKGKAYMDSNTFCGLACHTVMEPEYRAFVDSPHSRVGCAQCHIGPGADWFVKSKLSGIRQVFAVALGTYHRPIPSPVHQLRPARETCEQCHWPQKHTGDRLVVRPQTQEDEANTSTPTVLMLKIGGGGQGIHGRHLDHASRISYVSSDPQRLTIEAVWYRDDKGQVVEYLSQEKPPSETLLRTAERRNMDCVDCHNRPTHAFDLPEPAVDRALDEGRLDRSLPWLRREAVRLLRQPWQDRAAAERGIPEGLRTFYRAQYPAVAKERSAAIEAAGTTLAQIHLRNVWPHMKLGWGTHPNHLGHERSPGCFRCHDGAHVAKDGRAISSDCTSCHTILSQGEPDPAILKQLKGM